MTSIEVGDATAAALRSQATREGLSLAAYVRRSAVFDSVRSHDDVLSEQYYDDAEADRLGG